MGCQRMALLGFRLVNELLEASVPMEILKKPQRIAGSKAFVSECARCFLESPPLAFPAGLFHDITQLIVRVIESVTLCGTFTSRKTGHLWRGHDLCLAIDKAAVQIFALNPRHSEELRGVRRYWCRLPPSKRCRSVKFLRARCDSRVG